MILRQDPGHTRHPLFFAIALACAAGNTSAATVTVGSADDSAISTACNLRNAIASINASAATANCVSAVIGKFGGGDAIVFAPALAGSTITLEEGQLSVTAAMTILGSGQIIHSDPAGSRLIGATASLSLDHLILSGGTTTDSGGAISSEGASTTLTVSNSTVSGNHANGHGGGISVVASVGTFILSNSTITANTSNSEGGGMDIQNVHATISNSTIDGNVATCASNVYCTGGIYVAGAHVDFTHSTISGNSATCTGNADPCDAIGALYAWVSSVNFVDSTITGNNAMAPDNVVGGLWESHSTNAINHGLSLTNTTVAGNSATATAQTAANAAGGVLIGLHYDTGAITAANSIIASNAATLFGSASPTPDVNINAANAATAAISFSVLGTSASAAFTGNSNVFSDTPGLGSLANNGGPTKTMALLAGSVAIDAGSNALALDADAQPLTTDQTSSARIVNDTVDIGAYEFGDRIFFNGFDP
ncbi:MAG: choice-of-anchor Q domain-containing protein [Dokdonella sp.]